jgi:hypothetical protein
MSYAHTIYVHTYTRQTKLEVHVRLKDSRLRVIIRGFEQHTCTTVVCGGRAWQNRDIYLTGSVRYEYISFI